MTDKDSLLDEFVEDSCYARKIYSASRNNLLVALWGFFEKAASGLTQLYRNKLDECSDSQCLIGALRGIDSFYLATQEICQLAHNQGAAVGYNCQRLFLRDRFLCSAPKLNSVDIFSAVLPRDYLENNFHCDLRKRKWKIHASSTCHRYTSRRPPFKRSCLRHSITLPAIGEPVNEKPESLGFFFESPTKKSIPPEMNFDFSRSCDDQTPSRFKFSVCPSQTIHVKSIRRSSRPFKLTCNRPDFVSSTVVTKMLEAGGFLSKESFNGSFYSSDIIAAHLLKSPNISRKRLSEHNSIYVDADPTFCDAVHLSSLIDPLSKFGLDTFSSVNSPKRQRLNQRADLVNSSNHLSTSDSQKVLPQ